MSEYELETRLFGKEDIDFDSAGTNEQTEFTDLNGDTHAVTKLNASHIPLTQETRAVVDSATDVEGAIQNLHDDIHNIAGASAVGLSEDKVILLDTASTRQTAISAPFRNLGGHTLTFKFPEEGDVQVATAPLEFQGFYNGVLVIDLNGSDIHDNGAFSPEGVLRVKNCHCHVRIIGDGRGSTGYGKIIFTDNHYGIAIIESPSCSVEHIAFEGNAVAQDFAIYTESGNAFFASCTFTGCGQTLIKSIYRDYVDAHKVDASAHASLFAAKAEVSHTHTLDDITNYSSGALNSAHFADSAGYADRAAYADSAGDAATAGYADSAGSAASAGWADSAGHADNADTASGLTSSATQTLTTTIVNQVVSSVGYTGPFALTSVSSASSAFGYAIAAGDVNIGGSSVHIDSSTGGSTPLSNGSSIYLHFYSSVGGYDYEYLMSSATASAGHYYIPIGTNSGGKAVQHQYGDINIQEPYSGSAYDGPFAVNLDLESGTAGCNSGYVFAGGSQYLLNGFAKDTVPVDMWGGTVYLTLLSSGGGISSGLVTSPSGLPSGTVVVKLAERSDETINQIQYGNITIPLWGVEDIVGGEGDSLHNKKGYILEQPASSTQGIIYAKENTCYHVCLFHDLHYDSASSDYIYDFYYTSSGGSATRHVTNFSDLESYHAGYGYGAELRLPTPTSACSIDVICGTHSNVVISTNSGVKIITEYGGEALNLWQMGDGHRKTFTFVIINGQKYWYASGW